MFLDLTPAGLDPKPIRSHDNGRGGIEQLCAKLRGEERPAVDAHTEGVTDQEISLYFRLPVVNRVDPPALWRDHATSFPQLAKKYLCVPATSCSSERVFSVAGNIVSGHSGSEHALFPNQQPKKDE